MIEELQPEDFTAMVYNVHPLPTTQKVIDAFPILARHKEFHVVDDIVVRYIAFCYDMGSPLMKEDNILSRKIMAADLAGFKRDKNDRFSDDIIHIFNCENEDVNRAIIRYCRLLRLREYTLYVAGNESYHNTIEQLMKKDSGDDILKDSKLKQELFEKANDQAKRLDEMYMNIFAKDDTAHLALTAEEVMDAELLNNVKLSPEDHAKPEL